MSESFFGLDVGFGTPELQFPEHLRQPLTNILRNCAIRMWAINWACRVGFGRRPPMTVVSKAYFNFFLQCCPEYRYNISVGSVQVC